MKSCSVQGRREGAGMPCTRSPREAGCAAPSIDDMSGMVFTDLSV
jgi:hypothetical protein